MLCIQCGTYNPDNASFCGGCGSKFEKAASSASFMPIDGTPASGAAQSQSGEHVPIVPQMPPASSYPMSQRTPPNQGLGQTGYGMSQGYPPSTYPTSDQYGSAAMFNMPPPPSYTEQSSHPINDFQTVPQVPLWQWNQPTESPQTPIPPSVVKEPWYKALPKPMPLWAFIGTIVAVVLLLVVLQLTGSDWAAGAKQMGIVAGILALVVALAAVVRILLGMAAKSNPRRVIQLVSAGLAILLLLLLCLVGLTQQSTIHNLQAHNWEGQQQWQSSINEYQLAGEGAPTSENIAQVYNEWGEQFTSQQHYTDALAKFDTVLTNFGSASAGVARAQSDTIKAYLGWGQQASQQHDFTAATSHYDALLQLSYCNASCQSQANALDATAYNNLAESQLATKNYTDAVNNFQIVVSRFGSSSEAQKLHEDYAKALFGHGQEQLAASCSSAIPTYQQVSTQFGDTPEGQQAATALKAPQPVKGRFIGVVPNDPSLSDIAGLMKGINGNTTASQFYPAFNSNSTPKTTIQSNGSFNFQAVPQSTYDLVWGTNNNVDGQQSYNFYYRTSDESPTFVAIVGPLCPYDFGNINQDIPSAP